jgi:hypothetical protein
MAIIELLAGIAMGSIPSIATYIACRRGIYTDWVMSGMTPKQTLLATPGFVNPGDIPPLRIPSGFSGVNPPYSKLQQLHMMLEHFKENPNEWEFALSGDSIVNMKIHSGTSSFFGIQKKSDRNIHFIKSKYHQSLYPDAIYLNGVRVDVKFYDKNIKMFENEIKNQLAIKEAKLEAEAIAKLSKSLGFDKKEQAPQITRRPVSKTIDPFAQPAWEMAMEKIGKAQHSMVNLSSEEPMMIHEYVSSEPKMTDTTINIEYPPEDQYIRKLVYGNKITRLMWMPESVQYLMVIEDKGSYWITPENVYYNYDLMKLSLDPQSLDKMPSRLKAKRRII